MTTPITDTQAKNIATILEVLLHDQKAKKFPGQLYDYLKKIGLFKTREEAEELMNLKASGTYFEKFKGSTLAQELEKMAFKKSDLYIDSLTSHSYLEGPFRQLYLYTCIVFAFHHQLNILSVEKTDLFDLYRQFTYERENTSQTDAPLRGFRMAGTNDLFPMTQEEKNERAISQSKTRLFYSLVPYYKDSYLINNAVKLFFTRFHHSSEALHNANNPVPLLRQKNYTRVITNHAEKLLQAAIMTSDLDIYTKFNNTLPEIEEIKEHTFPKRTDSYYSSLHETNVMLTVFYPFFYLMLLSQFNKDAFKGIEGNLMEFNDANRRDYSLGSIVPTETASPPKTWQLSVRVKDRGVSNDIHSASPSACKEYIFKDPRQNEAKFDINDYANPVHRLSRLPVLFQLTKPDLVSAGDFISSIELRISKVFSDDDPKRKEDSVPISAPKDQREKPQLPATETKSEAKQEDEDEDNSVSGDEDPKIVQFCRLATDKLNLGHDNADFIKDFLDEQEFGEEQIQDDMNEADAGDSSITEQIYDEFGSETLTMEKIFEVLQAAWTAADPAQQEEDKKEETDEDDEDDEEKSADRIGGPLRYASSLRMPLPYSSSLYYTRRKEIFHEVETSDDEKLAHFLDLCAEDPELPIVSHDNKNLFEKALEEEQLNFDDMEQTFLYGNDEIEFNEAMDGLKSAYSLDGNALNTYYPVVKRIVSETARWKIRAPVSPRLSPSICDEPPGMCVFPDIIFKGQNRFDRLPSITRKFYAAPEDTLPLERKDFFIETCKKFLLKSFKDKMTKEEILEGVDAIYKSGISWADIEKDVSEKTSSIKTSILVEKICAGLGSAKARDKKICWNILKEAYAAASNTKTLNVKCMHDILEMFMFYAAKHEDVSFVDAMYLIMAFEKVRRVPSIENDDVTRYPTAGNATRPRRLR